MIGLSRPKAYRGLKPLRTSNDQPIRCTPIGEPTLADWRAAGFHCPDCFDTGKIPAGFCSCFEGYQEREWTQPYSYQDQDQVEPLEEEHETDPNVRD